MKGNTVGQTLLIGKEDYQNFEEIETRYVKECARKVLETKNHHKFLEVNSLLDLEEKLKEEQISNPSVIPYKFCIIPEFAGYVILGYMTPSKKFVKEYIKIKPRGFSFHELTQPTLNHLISFFKSNFSSIEY